MTTSVKELAIFNEEGLKLIELKRVLLENKNNSLIYDGLKNSLVKDNFKPEIYIGLDDSVNENEFIKILMQYDSYINLSVLEKGLNEFREKISNSLKNKGRKNYITRNSYPDASVYVIKKFGISTQMIMREFRLTKDEATSLLVSEFGEKFAKYKLEATVKDMVSNIQKYWHENNGFKYGIQFELSDFYFDKHQQIYNIDFKIKVPLTHHQFDTSIPLYSSLPKYNSLITEISTTLELLEKEYHLAKKHMQ